MLLKEIPVKYTSEDTTPCSKKIVVTVEAEEVNAAITAALTMQQQGLSLAGFRKGHVPLNIIEKRFKGQIYADAAQDLTNVHLNQILGDLKVTPISAMNVDPTPIKLVRDTECTYTVTFEHLPVFEVPAYEGIEVEQKQAAAPSEDRINEFIDRLRRQDAKYEPVDGAEHAENGQLVNIDLDVYDGETVVHSAHGQDLLVGQPGAEQIDELVKSLKVGETGEKMIDFPADFMLPALQGKTAKVKVTVYAIKSEKLPTDEQLLEKFKLSSMDEVRSRAVEVMQFQMNSLYRSEAQTALVDQLMKMVDFELPKSLLDNELNGLVERDVMQAQRAGKVLSDEQIAEAREKHHDDAVRQVKSYILLLTIAQKEGISASDQEVQARVAQQAGQYHVNPQELFNYYRESGYLYTIRDSILVDRAAQAVYAKAKVNMVEVAAPEAAAEAPVEGAAEEAK